MAATTGGGKTFDRIPTRETDAPPSDEESGGEDEYQRPSSWAAPEIVKEARGSGSFAIDVRRSRFPFAIVWTPLPFITWFLPFIGHMGLCDSRGVVYDFAGPYTIGVDQMAFSKPTRYLTLDPAEIPKEKLAPAAPGGAPRSPQEVWDDAIDRGADVYCRRMHNICCDNCHSHVARCLNIMRYQGSSDWNMVKLAVLIFFRGKYVSFGRAVQTWLPFLIVLTIIVVVSAVTSTSAKGRK